MEVLNNGRPHPSAPLEALAVETSITGTGLAVLRRVSDTSATQVVVWDWVTGQISLVRRSCVDSYALM